MNNLLCRRVIRGLTGFVAVFPSFALALEPGLNVDLSWEHVKLPETQFTFQFDNSGPGGFAPTGIVGKDTNHSGESDGPRVDLSLAARTSAFGSVPVVAGLKGYYALHDSRERSSCATVTIAAMCGHAPLFDPDLDNLNFGLFLPGDTFRVTADQQVSLWGIAFEAQQPIVDASQGALAAKSGVGYRAIDRTLDMAAINGPAVGGTGTPAPFEYHEDLVTHYLGAYVGALGKVALGYGWAAKLDGEVGLYWARTSYDGELTQLPVPFNPFALGSHALSLTESAPALIAAAKLGLDKDFGPLRVGLFVRGEYYSYVAAMKYNNVDRDFNLTPQPIGGTNDGTSIDDGTGWTASAGMNIAVPFN